MLYLSSPYARAEFTDADAVVFSGGDHDGEAEEESLHI